jgi:hypothetical protein
MLRAHAVAQRRPLLGGARELEGRGEPFERAHGEIEPFVHVNQEGVVRYKARWGHAAYFDEVGDVTPAIAHDPPPAIEGEERTRRHALLEALAPSSGGRGDHLRDPDECQDRKPHFAEHVGGGGHGSRPGV